MKRILVVEDQEDLRAILHDFLTATGYFVIEAVDGVEGVDKARSEHPDLVLMDIQLPGLDGYDATRQIKALPGRAATPIIAVSSFAMKGDEEKARASGGAVVGHHPGLSCREGLLSWSFFYRACRSSSRAHGAPRIRTLPRIAPNYLVTMMGPLLTKFVKRKRLRGRAGHDPVQMAPAI
jgi:two-component system cell cycle response regulator DivK